MKPVILFRKDISTEKEMEIASKYFEVYESRVLCGGSNVICRYSALPYYKELEDDLKLNSCKMVNSYKQHVWISDFSWYYDLNAVTPLTWFDYNFHCATYEGPFVVKCKTNSKKHQWNTLMYAEDKKTAYNIAKQLRNDLYLSQQGVVYREYVPLKTFEVGLNGLRFTNEWRFFFYKEMLLTYGYYWSMANDLSKAYLTEDGYRLAMDCARCVSKKCNFFVLDIAEREAGGWILIEINDGQMSGLSECNPDVLYSSLKDACEIHL